MQPGEAGFGSAVFSTRISQLSPFLARIAWAAIGAFAVRVRRLGIAAARHAGVDRTGLVLIQCIQHRS